NGLWCSFSMHAPTMSPYCARIMSRSVAKPNWNVHVCADTGVGPPKDDAAATTMTAMGISRLHTGCVPPPFARVVRGARRRTGGQVARCPCANAAAPARVLPFLVHGPCPPRHQEEVGVAVGGRQRGRCRSDEDGARVVGRDDHRVGQHCV